MFPISLIDFSLVTAFVSIILLFLSEYFSNNPQRAFLVIDIKAARKFAIVLAAIFIVSALILIYQRFIVLFG